jgi:cyclic pyranopterin phosphate synthase
MDESRGRGVRMVDVGEKGETERIAVASGHIRMSSRALEAVLRGEVPKGDVLGTARIASIQAAKRTWEWIPLCHPIRLTSIEVDLTPEKDLPGISIRAKIKAKDRTGVEMEALTAVSTGLLTIYDMLKTIDRSMEISEIRLDMKEGGRSGSFMRGEPNETE